jgi:hypothetical protein
VDVLIVVLAVVIDALMTCNDFFASNIVKPINFLSRVFFADYVFFCV